MKVSSASLTLEEAYEALRTYIASKLNCSPDEVGAISIESYGRPRVSFSEDGLFEAVETRHRLKGVV